MNNKRSMKLSWSQTWRILFLIVILGGWLRLSGLGNNSFVADEFLDINSSYGYFQTGQWKAWDFNYGKLADQNINDARDERAYIYKAQVAALFHFLSPTESNARLISVLWGIITIGVMFYAGYFFTGKKSVGLIAAFLFAVSISGIIFDRRLRMYAMFYPVFLLLATMLFGVFERTYRGKITMIQQICKRFSINGLYLLPFLLLAAVNALVHGLSLTLIPIFGVYALWQAILLWEKEENLHSKYTFVVGSGVALGALVYFFLPRLFALAMTTFSWFDNHYSYLGHFTTDFAHPLLGVMVALFGAWSLAHTSKRPKEAVFLVCTAFVPLALAIWFWRRNVGPQYIFFAQSFLLLLAANGVYGIANFVTKNLSVLGTKRALGSIVVLLILLPNYGYFLLENNTYHETSTGDNPSYRKVFDYFKRNKTESDVLITRNFRNYYFAGAKVPVYDFGGELSQDKLSLTEVEQIVRDHPHGWVVLSLNDYDYISHDAEVYFKKNMEEVSNPLVRGAVDVFHW